ncbi:MAG: hypothetical protein Q7T45_11405 [Bradyrhizobium sp.]|uniref:hypothetical protein n=1 Tax=Bradyrhizobium sp. TaxID=376 RepID=UPI002725D278|nr:hypothetical protein [Bradyrhizobium sp.]MDO8398413.1 hypothetical protein [Bradyrhizobium sp.]
MTETMSEGVKILYKGAIDNIIFLKRQQWIITNYSLVVYAIMAALAKNATSVEKTILVVVSLCAFGYSAACMLHTQNTMKRLRASMSHIYQTYFSVEEREVYKLWQAAPGFWYTPLFIGGLIAANSTALAVTVYVIVRTPYLLSSVAT